MGYTGAVNNSFRFPVTNKDLRGSKRVYTGFYSQTNQILAKIEPLSIDGKQRPADLLITGVLL